MKQYNFDEIISREGTHTVKYDLREMFFGNDKVLPMWVADMDFRTPDFIMQAIRKRAEHEILGYTIRPESFYQSIIDWNKKRHSWNIEKEWITCSPGVVPALNMAMLAYTKPGDNVIIQPPVYHPFFHAIENSGRTILENPLQIENGRYQMDFEALESAIDENTSMMLLSNPHNPGGTVWTKEELEQLGQICIKHNIIIISDEIHADLMMFGNQHTPLASISPEIAEITVTAMAPSKTFNIAALATSYLVVSNKTLLDKFNTVLEQIHVGMGNVFGTVALEAAYNHGEEWLNQLLSYLENNIRFVEEFFKSECPQVKVMVPEATYLVMLDFSALNLENEELKKLMTETALIGMNDGASFGKQGDGFQRLNIASPLSVVTDAVNRIKNAINTL